MALLLVSIPALSYASDMAGLHPEQVNYLKNKLRLFEDKKISGHDLSKEIHYVARELFDPSEATLRRMPAVSVGFTKG